MAAGLLTITLTRDTPQTPWGFRLHGGKDIGFPMVIQRVFLGSPSEGELQRGDLILQVQGKDTANMTHMEAHDVIKAAGQRLSLLIRRMTGGPAYPPMSPTSPVPPDGMHPYATLLRETEQASSRPVTPRMFQPMYEVKPLPTSPSCYSPATPMFRRRNIVADSDYHQEKEKETEAIVRQGYRSVPLIAPKPKTGRDVPVGSYLRFTNNPNWIGRSNIQPNPKPAFMSHYPTPTYSTIGIDSSRIRTPGPKMFQSNLDDNHRLLNAQYNSPINLYSQKNVDDTIYEQTGITPGRPKLNTSIPQPPNQAAAPQSPGTLAPARPGTKLANIVDITLSPTFQFLQEEEKRSASPQPQQQDVRSPMFARRAPQPKQTAPFDALSHFGRHREVIHQSGSFNALMSQLSAPASEQQI